MRPLAIRFLLSLSLLLVPPALLAHGVTLTGTNTFSALDGSAHDHDGAANGVFTVSDGDLVVTGVVNCNDDGAGGNSACAMTFAVSGNVNVNAGGALYAENRTGSGSGGAITITAGGHVTLAAGAVISSASKTNSSNSAGGAIVLNAASVSLGAGSTIDSGSLNAAAGSISITATGVVTVDGNVLAGPSRTIAATRLSGVALSGGTGNQSGGAVSITTTTFVEPAIVVGASANVISQGETATGAITIDGCGIEVRGLVAAISRDSAAVVTIRSGKSVSIDGRDLGAAGIRQARVRADSSTGTASANRVNVFASDAVNVFGPVSGLYAVSANTGSNDPRGDGGSVRVVARGGATSASGNAIDAGGSGNGNGGGSISIDAAGTASLIAASLRAAGDHTGNNSNRNGGAIRVRSYAGSVIWTNGSGDVRPVGSGSNLPLADQGSIVLTACGTVNTTGSTFPVNGTATSVHPQTQTGVCAPAAPALPPGVAALLTCNTPPVANDATAVTNEDVPVTITMSGIDADGDALTFSIVSPPSNGSLSSYTQLTATTASIVYSGNANFNGADSFVYQANDGNGGTDTATVTIAIAAVNDAPSFQAGPTAISLEDGGAQTYVNWATAISAGPADESGQTVTFSVANDNPSLFSVQPTVASNGTLTYTAAPNAYGSATLSVTAQDNGGTANGGSDTSAPRTGSISITAVNDAPAFTPGGNVTVGEDSSPYAATWATAISAGPNETQSLSFSVSNTNPALFSTPPAVSPSGVLTFAAATNANGSASVTVSLSDDGGTANGGVNTSGPHTFTVTVTSINDAPGFTSGGNVTVLEDSAAYSAPWATGINAGPADENGQSVTFAVVNNQPSLFTAAPSITPDGTLSFTVAPNAFGTATVTVTLSDDGGTANGGQNSSAAQTFTVVVNGVNDAPGFTGGGNVTVNEDSGAFSASWASGISAGAGETQNLAFSASNDNNALFSVQPAISASGVLSFTLAANANGTASVSVTLSDDGGTANGGVDTSAPQSFTINVTAVNDAPTFSSGGNVTVAEDSAAYSAAWATAISAGPADENGQSFAFSVSSDNNALFSTQPAIDGNGNLTFALVANANGSATVTVTLSDNGGTANGGVATSAAQTFTLTVSSVNDAPSFTAGGNVTVNEDSGTYSASWATAISAGPGESGQALTFNVSNDDNALFSVQPAISSSGVLTFAPAANAFGSATVTVSLSDNGAGNNTSASVTFTIAVTSVNDAPTFSGSGNVTVDEDSGSYSATWATAISAGPANEAGQTVSFTVSSSNAPLFSSQPVIGANGVLTFTTAPNAHGTSTVTVSAQDNGGTANGGVSASASQSFTITVVATNDPPSFTAGPNVTVNEDSGPYAAQWATNISAGEGEVQPLTFTVTNGNNGLFAIQPAISATGILTFKPSPNTDGVATVTVTLSDGIDASAPVTFTITVVHVNDLPVVNNESYETIRNTMLQVAGAQTASAPVVFVSGSLLANDSDPDNGPSPLSASLGATTPGATVVVNPDGTFTYVPPAGYTGTTDQFQYAVTDGSATALGTVTITLKGRVWYVDNSAAAGGTGRSHDRFDTLTEAEEAAGTGDIIYVFSGDGTTSGQNAGITLKANQRLLGRGVALDVPVSVNGGANPTVLLNAGTKPMIGNAAGSGVTINNVNGVEVAGLNIAGTTHGVDVHGAAASASIRHNTIRSAGVNGIVSQVSGTAALVIDGNSVTATGNAINVIGGPAASTVSINDNSVTSAAGNGINVEGLAVTVTGFANNSVSGDTAGAGIRVALSTFDAVPGGVANVVSGGKTTIGAAGNGVGGAGAVLANANGAVAFSILEVVAGGGAALSATSAGALSVSAAAGSLVATGGAAVNANQVTLGLSLASLVSTNSAAEGVSLVGVAGSLSAPGGAISGAAAEGFKVVGGAVSVSYGGSITSTSQNVVRVTGHTTGTLAFGGAITASGPNAGINVSTNSGSTVSFSGNSSISTAGGPAFTAVNGGTVTVTGGPHVLATTSGRALTVDGTTIGATGMTFRSVSANGAENGIYLNNTGTAGGLTVTGNGTAGSGGTIQNSSSHAILLASTTSPSFGYMTIQNSAGSGVKGTGVAGFSFSNGLVDSSGTGGGVGDSNIAFNSSSGSFAENNVSGAVTITNNTLTNSRYHGVDILNYAGTISSANISGNTITSSTVAASSLGNAIGLNIKGSGADSASLVAASISNNVITNFPSGAGIRIDGGNGFPAGPSSNLGTPGSASAIVSVTGNRLRGASAALRMGTQAINVTVSGKGAGNVVVSNNGTAVEPITNVNGVVISVAAFGHATVEATVANNVIVANNLLASPGISVGVDSQFAITDAPSLTVNVLNNKVSATNGSGILAVARNSSGVLRAKIQSNIVAAPTSGVRQGIRVDSGTTLGNTNVCLNISGNTSAGSGGTNGIGLRKQGTSPAVNAFGVNGMAATATPDVENYINSLNPTGGGTLLLSATGGFTSCSLP